MLHYFRVIKFLCSKNTPVIRVEELAVHHQKPPDQPALEKENGRAAFHAIARKQTVYDSFRGSVLLSRHIFASTDLRLVNGTAKLTNSAFKERGVL